MHNGYKYQILIGLYMQIHTLTRDDGLCQNFNEVFKA